METSFSAALARIREISLSGNFSAKASNPLSSRSDVGTVPALEARVRKVDAGFALLHAVKTSMVAV